MNWGLEFIGVVFLAWAAFIGLFPRTGRDTRWRQSEAESRAHGYRLSIASFWLWVDRTRFRSALVALIFLAFGVFTIALGRASN